MPRIQDGCGHRGVWAPHGLDVPYPYSGNHDALIRNDGRGASPRVLPRCRSGVDEEKAVRLRVDFACVRAPEKKWPIGPRGAADRDQSEPVVDLILIGDRVLSQRTTVAAAPSVRSVPSKNTQLPTSLYNTPVAETIQPTPLYPHHLSYLPVESCSSAAPGPLAAGALLGGLL